MRSCRSGPDDIPSIGIRSQGPSSPRPLMAHLGPRVRCANAPLSEAERTSYEVQRGFNTP
ncbi:hypothetical protein C7G42_12615 [Bradyrhizobium sp. MOS003]|nr:hypothetical protein C7G42_12615 [Bradyrhizobium sp. MOS003]